MLQHEFGGVEIVILLVIATIIFGPSLARRYWPP
jgi:Sec-independent protein translocase protein TatA